MFLSLVQDTGCAVRSIDVKPEVKLLRNVRDLIKRINDTGIYSSRTPDYTKRSQPFANISRDALTQRVDAHSLPIVTRNDTHLIAPEAENIRSFRDRHVNFF